MHAVTSHSPGPENNRRIVHSSHAHARAHLPSPRPYIKLNEKFGLVLQIYFNSRLARTRAYI